MLDTASDYEQLDVAGLARFIKGDVWPVREVRGDGSWRAMKYEDLLFLLEAVRERGIVRYENHDEQNFEYWKQWLAQNFSPANAPRFEVPPIQRIYRQLREWATDPHSGLVWSSSFFVNPDVTIPADGTVVEVNQGDSIFGERTSACEEADAPDIFALPYDEATHRYIGGALGDRVALKGDTMRRCFWLVKRLTRSAYNQTDSHLPEYGSHDMIQWAYYPEDTEETDYPEDEREVQRMSGRPSTLWGIARTRVSWSTAHAANVTWSRPRKTSHLANATAVFRLQYSHTGSADRFFGMPLRCTVQDGRITDERMGDATADYMASRVLAKVGRPYVADGEKPTHLAVRENESVSLVGVRVLCDHEFPAEVNSTGWEWTPPREEQTNEESQEE